MSGRLCCYDGLGALFPRLSPFRCIYSVKFAMKHWQGGQHGPLGFLGAGTCGSSVSLSLSSFRARFLDSGGGHSGD